MKSKYRVSIAHISYTDILIDAENEDHAREIALEEFNAGRYEYDGEQDEAENTWDEVDEVELAWEYSDEEPEDDWEE